jgi:isoleucyl-tRNA synthetase
MTKKTFYPEVKSNADFAELEKNILEYWRKHNVFQRSIENKQGSKEFVFYDGPPFANGLPHYGHLLTGFIKDTYARYQTIQGKKVERRFGWDCHGLPAEMQAEKELGFSGRLAITKYGIDKFNEHCKSSVMKYTKEWEQYVTRQARWVDFNNPYKTMDLSFMESVLWAFKELYKKGLIYESMRVMPYSWACETPLSNFETRLDNAYRERADKSVTCSFILNEKPKKAPSGFKEYRVLAWTTTPWTLPSNLALAIGADIEYVFVKKGDVCYVLANFALSKYTKELDEQEPLSSCLGKDLAGITYKPLFDYFTNHKNSFKILAGDFVVEGDGTGIVHIAPGFGEDDQVLCQQYDIELVCPVDNSGKFTREIYDLEGLQVFDANDKIIIKLKEQGSWVKTEQFLHNYPHCWRTDTPLIYKAVPSWYVKVTEFKDRMVQLNQQINWIPGGVKDNLFGKWLENAHDWSISRNRFFGTPIPVWRSDDPKYPRIDVYGSIEELEKDFGVKVDDLHRPFIDQLTRPNPDDPTGKSMMRRVEDVFDCWFESGSMPYGQVHYPFENKDWFESHFPADFIVEYSAQTRGWFYTLMVLSTALFDRPPFLNCICHGVILDSTGQKLSKRLNNYADPLELFEKYGSDALRVCMLSSPVVQGQELLIDKEGKMVYETLRLFIKPIWDAYNFFTMYANADGIICNSLVPQCHSHEALLCKPVELINNGLARHGEGALATAAIQELYSFVGWPRSLRSLAMTDTNLYILLKLSEAVNQIEHGLDNFDSQVAYGAIAAFFEVLNNWYIRRNRSRFWKSEQDADKQNAYDVLYTCLETMCRAMSSLLPLISEEIYLGLTGLRKQGDSVHLKDFPKFPTPISEEEQYRIIKPMDQIRDICSAAHSIRHKENIRTRQPLQSLTIALDTVDEGTYLNYIQPLEDLIKDELNVKEIIFETDISKFADHKLSINFPILGKRLPDKMKEIIAASKKGDWFKQAESLLIAGIELSSEEYTYSLEPKKDQKGVAALSNTVGVVKLDLEISEELRKEGIARDLIRFIQQARKDANFNISDHIKIEIIGDIEIDKIVKSNEALITEQTLSKFDIIREPDYESKCEITDKKIILKLKNATSST